MAHGKEAAVLALGGFARDANGARVLDSNKSLRQHRRTDFGRMKPKWFIEVRRKPGN